MKLTSEQIKKIIELSREGASLAVLSEKFHVDRKTIYYHLQKNSSELKREEMFKRGEEIFNLYKKGMSRKEIAKKFNITSITVGYWLFRFGVRLGKGKTGRKQISLLTDKERIKRHKTNSYFEQLKKVYPKRKAEQIYADYLQAKKTPQPEVYYFNN